MMFSLVPQTRIPDQEISAIYEAVGSAMTAAMGAPSDLPELLYHYTNAAGLKGIAESDRLRASHVSFLNDAKEYWHAVDVFREVVSERRQQTQSDPAEIGNLLLDELIGQLSRTAPSVTLPLFVFSLSEERNALSQWRAYGGAGGYSIGFDARALTQGRSEPVAGVSPKWGPVLAPAVYSVDQLRNIADGLLNWAIAECRARESDWGAEAVSRLSNWAQHFLAAGALVAPQFKNAGFAEEKEWRIIYLLQSTRELQFVSKPGLLVPCVYLQFGESGEPETNGRTGSMLPIATLTSGPGANSEIGLLAGGSLLEKEGHVDVALKSSEIPYRTMGT